MMKHSLFLSGCLLTAAVAAAVDCTRLADVDFLERYALSTNRSEVIATLKPDSDPWFVFSVLDAQTAGRLKEAENLLASWRQKRVNNPNRDWYDLKDRQILLAFDPQNPKIGELRNALFDCGIRAEGKPRQVEIAPNTYPSVLSPASISFNAFWSQTSSGMHRDTTEAFGFLPFIGAPYVEAFPMKRFEPPASDRVLPDSPGLLELVIAYYRTAPKEKNVDISPWIRSLTLAQLETFAEGLKDTDHDVYGNAEFAKAVLAKLVRGADDDPAGDPSSEEALLLRRVAFVNRLKPSLANFRREAYGALLSFGRDHAKEIAYKDHFLAYLDLEIGDRSKTETQAMLSRLLFDLAVRENDLVRDYLAAFCRAGVDLSFLEDRIESTTLCRAKATEALLSGRPASDVDMTLFSEGEFAALRDRLQLDWAKTNPAVFAADDDVTLTLDVKNVKRMRLAVYELDPFEACRTLGGEVKRDIDLDGAVPTWQRAIDFSRYPAIVRHTENLILPELKKPGLYIVECSSAGRASRAIVRKGRLRATERHDSGGHVFCALDEDGRVVKGTKLRLGETVFTADEAGEIAVPFAADPKAAGEKVAVIGDGRLATTLAFTHRAETIGLSLGSVIVRESLVAGRQATVLLRPTVRVADHVAPLAVLEQPRLTLTFTDLSGATRIVPHAGLTLADDAESVVTFTVPERLASLRLTLEGRVRSAVTGDPCPVSASTGVDLADPRPACHVAQVLLRKGAEGHWLELRGLNGEPLPDRAADLEFWHRAFSLGRRVRMQSDENGCLFLGPLTDIERLTMKSDTPGLNGAWSLSSPRAPLPAVLTAAEGESFELPIRDLFAGEWPGARRMDVRVSLLEKSADGQTVANRIKACSYKNGILKIENLPAGDYTLTLRDRNESCRLCVARTAGKTVEGGVLASSARSLTDIGSPNVLRLVSASLATNGCLTATVAGATPATRLHLVATRTRSSEDSAVSQFAALLERPDVRVGSWSGRESEYVTGRDLGDKMRYILDRRDQPSRVGNLLDRPSLLLNPWSLSDTTTTDVELGAGQDWKRAEGRSAGRSGRYGGNRHLSAEKRRQAKGGAVLYDFLPEAATVVANLRPDGGGRVTVDLSGAPEVGLRAQDFLVVATDGTTMDSVELLRNPEPFACRDLRFRNDPSAPKTRALSRTLAPGADLFNLLRSILGDCDTVARPTMLSEFAFLADWPSLTEEQKRAKYDAYASHELDVFLYEQDRPFFTSVVRPHLANKRLKQFIDRWLLEEDLSAYADSAARAGLNAFELCLLARRMPELAPRIARQLDEWCRTHPESPSRIDEIERVVFGFGTEATAFAAPTVEGCCLGSLAAPCEAMMEDDELDEGEAPADIAPERPVVMDAVNMSSQRAVLRAAPQVAPLVRKELARRASRQLYRPPERTKEWVETHYYRWPSGTSAQRLVPVNSFWRDYAAAIAEGRTESFASGQAVFATCSPTEILLACAVTKAETVVTRDRKAAERSPLQIVSRFRDPNGQRPNGTLGAEVTDEFVKGRVYEQVWAVTNPTDEEVRESVVRRIPTGAVALRDAKPSEACALAIGPYSVETVSQAFYFPEADATDAPLPVLDKPSKTDVTSWSYVSQRATKGEVLAYLREKNLTAEAIDLSRLSWRMKDGAYARQVLEVLDARGVYDQSLWLSGLLWRDAFDPQRIRQVLMRPENRRRVAERLGTALDSPLVTIVPERDDLFEHKEYWPLVNARAHAVAGASRLANQDLAKEYKAFLGSLATQRALTSDDRLLLAVYLIAQDRLEEARTQVSLADPKEVGTKLQFAYLQAYLAFCAGDAGRGRALAAPYADHPVEHWRRRFREVLAQADEILGGADGSTEADRAPTLALAAGGEGLRVTARHLASCTLRAYPMDLEILFSKHPFDDGKAGRATLACMKPAWETEVALTGPETFVRVPEALAARNLIVVATGAEGRAEARLEVTPRVLDVQVSREYRQLRVRDAAGRPLPGTYVKVYARDAAGTVSKFHKDGYTDLRGVFDYASVSTDGDFKPAEYAILVLHETAGVKQLMVKE